MKSLVSEEASSNVASRKGSLVPHPNRHDMKHFIFYNTFVTRQDLLNISKDDHIEVLRNYFISVVMKRFDDALRDKLFLKEKGSSAFALITFEHTVNNSVSQATQEHQNMCKHGIFSEFLSNIYTYCKKKAFNFEQQSTLLSICFYIFVESLEKKKNQIDSYEMFKRVLKAQILLTNAMNLPQFSQPQIIDFNDLMVNTFYKYYSLYELRMTIYQEVNIYPKIKGETLETNIIDEEDDETQFIEDDSGDYDEAEDQDQDEMVHQRAPQKTAAQIQQDLLISEHIQTSISSFNERLNERVKEQEERMLKEVQDSLQPAKKK